VWGRNPDVVGLSTAGGCEYDRFSADFFGAGALAEPLKGKGG